MNIYSLAQITQSLNLQTAASLIAEGFIAYSQENVQSPPVQSFQFTSSNGDCCVKSAWIRDEETFSVRISAGFYDNPAKGLSSNNGVTLVFSSTTGQPLALLKDGGWLTSMRTALAGQLVARAMAPANVTGIGIVGTGDQARMQLEQLTSVTICRRLTVYGRNLKNLERYRLYAESLGFDVVTTQDAKQVASNSNLIVTATNSREAIIASDWVKPGTHITAIGADGPGKQELDERIFAQASTIVVDSVAQCSQYGEVSAALKAGLIQKTNLISLGSVLAGYAIGRHDDSQITVADLTGLGVQDNQIAKAVLASCVNHRSMAI